MVGIVCDVSEGRTLVRSCTGERSLILELAVIHGQTKTVNGPSVHSSVIPPVPKRKMFGPVNIFRDGRSDTT